jgi:hypothetical protein
MSLRYKFLLYRTLRGLAQIYLLGTRPKPLRCGLNSGFGAARNNLAGFKPRISSP